MNHIELAFSQYGVREIRGQADNPKIIEYFDDLGFDGKAMKDETAWCSAFANWVCKNSDLEYTGKLNARSWMEIGKASYSPKLGDIVVLWRENITSWKGHVGFYVNEMDGVINILGGNQGNQVCVRPYPKNRVLTYRRLT